MKFRLRGPGLQAKYRRRCLYFCGTVLLLMIGFGGLVSWKGFPYAPWMNRLSWALVPLQLAIPLAFLFTERKILALKGRCWMCGYSRNGLGPTEACPECSAPPHEPHESSE